MPARRSPARFLAPLALMAFVGVLIAVASGSSNSQSSAPAVKAGPRAARAPRHRLVVVHTGDTLSRIALRNHVSMTTIEQLNPQLDPNALRVGQRLKLAP